MEAYGRELVNWAEAIEARENDVMRREQALEEAVEERAQNLFREMKEKFFKKVMQALAKLKHAIAKALGHILAFEIRERVNVIINQEIDRVIENLEGMRRDKDDRTEGSAPEEWDIVDKD